MDREYHFISVAFKREFCRISPFACDFGAQSLRKFNNLERDSLHNKTGNFRMRSRENISGNREFAPSDQEIRLDRPQHRNATAWGFNSSTPPWARSTCEAVTTKRFRGAPEALLYYGNDFPYIGTATTISSCGAVETCVAAVGAGRLVLFRKARAQLQ